MTSQLAPTSCPACTGFGALSSEHGLITCTTCAGTGMWLQQGDLKLLYKVPELLVPKPPKSGAKTKWLRHGLYALSFAVCLSSFFFILYNATSAAELVWQRDWAHFVFGVSGLTSMWSLSHWNARQSSRRSLRELAAELAKPPTAKVIDLQPFANQRVGELLEYAAYSAKQLHSSTVDDGILLFSLLSQPRIKMMLARLEFSPDSILETMRGALTKGTEGNVQSVSFQPIVRQRIYAAFQQAVGNEFPYVDLEDILLAYADDPQAFAPLFEQFGLGLSEVYGVTRWFAEDEERSLRWAIWRDQGRSRPRGFMNRAWTALPTPFLDQFSIDLTSRAAMGGIQVSSVRTAEIERTLQVLNQDKQNSVLLVGDPGVGKSTALATIALRMLDSEGPERLRDKRLVQVDLGALLNSGQSPERNVQKVLEEVGHAGNVILAVPEVQALVGTNEGALDAAATLANAIKQGYLQVISSATYGDYHRYVESNSLLSALLTVIELKPASVEQAVRVLEEEAGRIEHKHNIVLSYPALATAAKLAEQYFPDKPLPGSAVELLEEAASSAAAAKKHWVVKEDIEKVVEARTQIPVQQANQEEAEKLLHFEDQLHTRVVGQEQAVKAVAEALRRSRAGLRNTEKPISSFLFIGPTGVGKTEMAKAVADLYFGNRSHMVRLDMSEYQDNRSIYRLIGAPAADANSYTEGGVLTQAIREHPFSLILLDELEKADPEVLNLFLQLLDDGRVTENTGRTVHFNNTIIIATSNAGSDQIVKLIQQGSTGDDLNKQILALLQQHFKPEFINRFDGVIPFEPLTKPQLIQITTMMLQDVAKKASEQGISLQFAPDAVEKLAELGFDPVFGARPLRRVIQDKAEGLLAKRILEGSLGPNKTLQITAEMIQ